MSSSESVDRISVIERLFAGKRLAEDIEEPLDCAAENFAAEVAIPLTLRAFRVATGRFVQHLFRLGLQPSREITLSCACATAEDLLNTSYRVCGGYYAAYLDGRESASALAGVFQALLGAMKEVERERYERSILAEQTSGWEWGVQIEITRSLLKRLSKYLPDDLRELSPAQLSGSWLELLRANLSIDEGLGRQLSENSTTTCKSRALVTSL